MPVLWSILNNKNGKNDIILIFCVSAVLNTLFVFFVIFYWVKKKKKDGTSCPKLWIINANCG